MTDSLCPCQSGRLFSECCEPLLQGHAEAHSPEQLMRSRFSAFATKNSDYLLHTLLPISRKPSDRQELEQSFQEIRWVGLRVVNAGDINNHRGEVEFIAFFIDQSDKLGQIHERSTFIQKENRWFYADGSFLPPVKLPRNEPCVCGSGKKLKKCCGI